MKNIIAKNNQYVYAFESSNLFALAICLVPEWAKTEEQIYKIVTMFGLKIGYYKNAKISKDLLNRFASLQGYLFEKELNKLKPLNLCHTNHFTTFKTDENGNLIISLNDFEDLQTETNRFLNMTPSEALMLLADENCGTGGAWGNGWYLLSDDEKSQLGHLTDAPMIGYDVEVDDDCVMTGEGNFWYFPNYMIENEIETLFETGKVVFKKL